MARYYVVFVGRVPGVYETWEETHPQVSGFRGVIHMRINSRTEADLLFAAFVEKKSQLPLYGIHSTTGIDPFYWMRVILASSRGTVMELADAYVLCGMYGSINQLGVGNTILIIVQLVFSSIIMMCLDELLQKGGRRMEFESAVIALVHLLISRTDKVCALPEAFFRHNLPNMTNLLAIVLMFLVVIYFQENFGRYFLVRVLGSWKTSATADDPIHALLNLVFILSTCAILSIKWIDISGSSAQDVAQQLKEQRMVIPGYRDENLPKSFGLFLTVESLNVSVAAGVLFHHLVRNNSSSSDLGDNQTNVLE
ncbi:hypothetical protein GIB67_018126 [Kingdonia uniflora]|nr:hypothetical protein GIB67_018126 [Kingdonia uniflora]